MATASSISPSGMQLAGKYGIGVLSIASNSTEGIQALPTQWGFAEEAAAAHGSTVDRRDWRVLMAFHLAETREQARAEAVHGLHRWHNEYNVWTLGRPGAVARRGRLGAARAHDRRVAPRAPARPSSARPTTWSRRSATSRSSPAGSASCSASPTTGPTARRRCGRGSSSPATSSPSSTAPPPTCAARSEYLHDNQAELMGGASRAVMSKIMAHDGAAKAMATTIEQMAAQQAAAGNPTTPPSAPAPASRPDRILSRRRRAWREFSSGESSGAGDGGEGDGRGVADVERVDAAVDRDPHPAVGGRRARRPTARALGAEQHAPPAAGRGATRSARPSASGVSAHVSTPAARSTPRGRPARPRPGRRAAAAPRPC